MLLLIILSLLIWDIVLTILIYRLYHKNKKVICKQCGGTQIASFRQSTNNENRIINVCQSCGATWELTNN